MRSKCVFIFLFALVFSLTAGQKGGKAYSEGKNEEARKEWEKALALYESAMLQDPADVRFQIAVKRVRFQAAQARVDRGKKARADGRLEDALADFEKAYQIDPASTIAEQEMRRTIQMMEREGKQASPAGGKGVSPSQQEKKKTEDRIALMTAAPELRPPSRKQMTLKMNNQPPRILFETIARLAGVNVIFDSEYQPVGRNFFVDLDGSTLEQALDFVALQTKSFWKPLSRNTIFVTQESASKRRDYEDMMVKTFYLTNVTSVQELQDIAQAVRAVTELRRLFTYNGQYMIVARGTVDQVALAEKLIHDMDKARAEVVIDVVVMEISRTKSRDLAASLASGGVAGIDTGVGFTPRNPILTGDDDKDDSTSTPKTSAISLARMGRVSTNDFSVTLPGAIFKALVSDRQGRVLQSPQVRAVESQKATLRIGDKIPFASGSFQSGLGSGGSGLNPLVSTQFQFAEVGVNVDITPKVHGQNEVSLHVELELSTVRERIDIGGLKQPVIGQRRILHDVRMKEGEVSLLGGLQSLSDSLNTSGIPGLGQVPVLKRLFGSESKERIETELMIALIPHVVRSLEITPANLKGIAAGSEAALKMSYLPREDLKEESNRAEVAGGVGQVSMEPSEVKGQVTGNVFFTVQLNQGIDVVGSMLRVDYDSNMLQWIGVAPGNALSPDGKKLTVKPTILPEDGEARVELNRPQDSNGVNTSGPLALLQFRAVRKGTTAVRISKLRLRNSKGNLVELPSLESTVSIE